MSSSPKGPSLRPRTWFNPDPLLPQKCDEQREGDSCKTCRRLTIKCLGWGPKRPDWMRVSGHVASQLLDQLTYFPRTRRTSMRTRQASKLSSRELASSVVNLGITPCKPQPNGLTLATASLPQNELPHHHPRHPSLHHHRHPSLLAIFQVSTNSPMFHSPKTRIA